ncbi:fumarylacetoacetate hydrolase family protein [Agarilytica rhodophyticola]|uniref:fumarylacetoacetate hydrolase family protein n=1 Tax=Agarilytica rhodophyticola TaxID=1737490 RepID=UPI000B345157|nr:fumarylacetoacetate hydrolase family protein [Agarilytica rhodophyticola]
MQTVNFGDEKIAPSKIVCVGRNYAEHARELGNDIPDDIVFFVKPNSAISNRPKAFIDEPLHYEAELCFLIENNSFAGLGLGLDLTKRALQSILKEKRLPWERAKAFNGAAVFSDFIPLPNSSLEALRFEMSIDGELRQAAGFDMMLNKPEKILNECSSFMSLQDGDIIMTGTPKGVGKVPPGGLFEGQIFYQDKPILQVTWLAE